MDFLINIPILKYFDHYLVIFYLYDLTYHKGLSYNKNIIKVDSYYPQKSLNLSIKPFIWYNKYYLISLFRKWQVKG